MNKYGSKLILLFIKTNGTFASTREENSDFI